MEGVVVMGKDFNKIFRAIKFLLVFVICVGVLLCAGCSKKESTAVNLEESGYTVTDLTNTKLTFSEKSQRIVSMSIGTDEILTRYF